MLVTLQPRHAGGVASAALCEVASVPLLVPHGRCFRNRVAGRGPIVRSVPSVERGCCGSGRGLGGGESDEAASVGSAALDDGAASGEDLDPAVDADGIEAVEGVDGDCRGETGMRPRASVIGNTDRGVANVNGRVTPWHRTSASVASVSSGNDDACDDDEENGDGANEISEGGGDDDDDDDDDGVDDDDDGDDDGDGDDVDDDGDDDDDDDNDGGVDDDEDVDGDADDVGGGGEGEGRGDGAAAGASGGRDPTRPLEDSTVTLSYRGGALPVGLGTSRGTPAAEYSWSLLRCPLEDVGGPR